MQPKIRRYESAAESTEYIDSIKENVAWMGGNRGA